MISGVPTTPAARRFRSIHRDMFTFGFGDSAKDPPPQEKKDFEAAQGQSHPARFLEDVTDTPTDGQGLVDIVDIFGGDLLLRKACADVPKLLSPQGADVVPGVYEGGFKLWECAEDLAMHLYNNCRADLKDKAVLEIGAGHALPSVLAALSGAAITVHDFNEEVLRSASAPNVSMNMAKHAESQGASNSTPPRYIAGDWGSIPSIVGADAFDVVLSSETVYAEEQLRPLARCIISVLKDGGVAFIAGKTYYFGVGGGMQAFRTVVAQTAKEMSVCVSIDVVKELRDGRSNVREIAKFVVKKTS